jgi:ectoine hydroxylase-related dioxygenase (phytanoyl-CoA dioxygenase family)
LSAATGLGQDRAVPPLSDDDISQFARDGYLVVPNVVPEPLLVAADLEIDRLVEEVAPTEGDGGPGPNLWFSPRSRLPRCDDVLRASPALEMAQELVAPLSLDHAFDHIQVATTVPPWPHTPGGPHIDGHAPGQGPPASFTMLVGALLTDQRAARAGNLWVWPGSHHDHARLFQERGTSVLKQTGGHSTLLAPPAALNPPVEVTGQRGDVVLAHFLLGHNKGGNTGPGVRRTIYYRLAVPGHAERWESTFLDPWTEYEPVRRVVSSSPPGRLGA